MTAVRRLALAAALCALAGAGPTPVASAQPAGGAPHETYRVAPNRVLTLRGHGYGHGHGMSQFGAYGAALDGLSATKIVEFYYPHTTIAAQPMSRIVRVLLGNTSTRSLVVDANASHLTASTDATGVKDCPLPASLDGGKTAVTQWRAKVMSTSAGPRMHLQYTTDGTSWQRLPAKVCGAAWSAPIDASIAIAGRQLTRLVRPSGGVTRYRGALRAAVTGSHIFVVNVVRLESYLRSVVPSEMPSSWSAAALQAQAIAARTYASYGIAHPKNKPDYDVYDDTRDQMYTGVGSEVASSDDAVAATEDASAHTAEVLHDSQGAAAFTQFSSSDGGWTVAGGQAYLPAQHDPYDGVPKVSWNPHTWSASIPASTVESAFPSIGTLRSLVVDARDGNGQWGGRITQLTLHGSAGDVALTGADFRYDFGLRSEWFTVLEPPRPPTEVTATRSGADLAVGWQPAVAHANAPVTGYDVVLQPGGAHHSVGRDATSVSFSGLDPATDYTVSVTPTSKAGPGMPSVVTSKVSRLTAPHRVELAASISAATFGAGKAHGVVLARRGGDVRYTLAAGPLAAAHHAPVLLTGRDALPAATKTELQRVLPAGGTVYLLGPSTEIATSVRAAVKSLGYQVVRYGGANPDRTAATIASALAATTTVQSVFEVSADDPAAAFVAGPAAARRHGVILLTDGTTQSPQTASWLADHHDVTKHFAIGPDAAAADPAATAVGGADDAATAAAVATRWFAGPVRAGVVSATQPTAGLLAGARFAVRPGPLLLAGPTNLADGVRSYLTGVRAGLRSVQLVGWRLPYDDVESDVQKSLLG
jgi:stage II sporulation protein D